MRTRRIQQAELFDETRSVARPTLQEDVRTEVLQLLTQWLRALGETMTRETGNEQDRR
jgi:hypothetical protein